MAFRISGQNLDVGSALRDRITDRVAEAMAKYFDGGYSGHLTLARDGFGFRAECAIHLDSKITLHAEGMAPDAYASADQAALRIEKRLRRYHRRLKDHRAERVDDRAAIDAASIDAATYVIAAPEPESEREIDGFTPVIIAESTTRLKQLSVSDAVTELDMTGAPVLVFRHAAHGGINIVYRRADGHFGWIDPPAAAAPDAH
jgi:ribosomal subunit interface protein